MAVPLYYTQGVWEADVGLHLVCTKALHSSPTTRILNAHNFVGKVCLFIYFLGGGGGGLEEDVEKFLGLPFLWLLSGLLTSQQKYCHH